MDYPTCKINGIRYSTQQADQAQDASSPLGVREPQHPRQRLASAVPRLGPQAQMFLHMHTRLKQSPAYAEYKRGLRPRAAMKSALDARWVIVLWSPLPESCVALQGGYRVARRFFHLCLCVRFPGVSFEMTGSISVVVL